MFSKNRGALLAMAAGAVVFLHALMGCSLKTGDKPQENTSIRFKSSKYSCLADVGGEVDRYLKGEFNEAKVDMFITCLKNALRAFEYYARGEDLAGYAPMEIANFLNKNFLYENKLHEPLVREIMTIKTMMVGGSENFITRSEYAELVKFLDVVREEAIHNLPYVRLYKIKIQLTPLDRVDPVLLRSAKTQLVATARRLAEHLSKTGKTYSFDSFERLLRESRRFLNWEGLNESTIAPEDLRELTSRFKEISVGHDRQGIKAGEWRPFLESVAGVYGAYLDFEYLVRGQDMLYGAGLENFIQLSEHVLSLFQDAINRQERKTIEFPGIFGIIDILGKIQALPLNIRAESLKPALKYTIQYVLKDPVSNVNPEHVIGLNMSNLTEARKEFYNWAESQRFLNRLAEEELRRQGVFSGLDYVPFFGSMLKNFDLTPLMTAPQPRYQDKNIEYLVKNVQPMFRVGDNRVWIVPAAERELFDIRHGLHDLGRLNVIRAVVRQLIRGFADSQRVAMMATDPGRTGVTDMEMEKFYQTARSLGEDLLFMDPRKDQVGLRIFREGNIFTFAGNGIQEVNERDWRHLMNFTETIEVISFMWSGGQVRDALHSRISKVCEEETKVRPELDILNTIKIDRQCFFKHISDNNFVDFANLPYMQAYLNQLTAPAREQFFAHIQEISKIPDRKGAGACYDTRHIELAELATMATVLHYVEAIFTIYDANRNGILDEREVMSAFPRFRGFLAEAVEQVTGTRRGTPMLKAIFAFIVRERRFPETFGEKAGLLIDSWGYSDDPDVVDNDLPRMAIDRAGILDVLVMLNESTQNGNNNNGRGRVQTTPIPNCPAH